MTLGHFTSAGNFILALDTDAPEESIQIAITFGPGRMSEFIPYGRTAFACKFQGSYGKTIAFLNERAEGAALRAQNAKRNAWNLFN